MGTFRIENKEITEQLSRYFDSVLTEAHTNKKEKLGNQRSYGKEALKEIST